MCRFFLQGNILYFRIYALVAQLDRASASEAEGCGFNPRREHQSSFLAMLETTPGHALYKARNEDCHGVAMGQTGAKPGVLIIASTVLSCQNISMKQQLHYVYILKSEEHPDRHYTGFTDDLKERLESHNAGHCPHTSKYLPWHLMTYFAFDDRQKALDFERYLKTHSGRAFSKKHF